MKRIVLRSGTLAAIVLSVSVVGCGGSGIDQAVPKDLTPGVPLDPKMVDMAGRSFSDSKKAKAKAETSAKDAAPATPPAPEKKD